MKSLKHIILTGFSAFCVSVLGCAQGTVRVQEAAGNMESPAIIPDKVFEVAVPLLILFLVMNTLVSILKHRADNQLKTKAIEKGISEDTLLKLFGSSEQILRMQPLKWFLLTFSIGISLVIIHFLRPYLDSESGYLAVGIILMLASGAFYFFYIALKRRFKS
jgi:hypothetical protein